MNNDIRTTLQFICLTTVLLLGGCQKQTEEIVPTILELSPPTESQTEIDSIQDPTPSESTEALSTEHDTTAPTASSTIGADSALLSLTKITKDFHPSDGWTSALSFQLPEEWSYTADEDMTDWGFLIQVENREDSYIRIYGQHGTINVGQFYTNTPVDFVTAGGIRGNYYQELHISEDGTSCIEGDIVFDQNMYDIHFYMPEDIFHKNHETLQSIFESVMIEDIIAE